MGYCDYTDAWLRDLTRQRRRERLSARREPIRFSVVGYEFTASIPCQTATRRRKVAAKMWRIREWRDGHRDCAYCRIRMTSVPKHGLPGPTCVTVDHKQPLILGGDDDAPNWALCCWLCNNRKGSMTEAEFRSLLAAESRLALAG